MKNNLLSGLWLLAAATALCSCANEAAEELPENNPTQRTITASIDQQESRVALGGDKNLNVHWEAGDKILGLSGVFNRRFQSECLLISGAGTSVATFLIGEEIPTEPETPFSKTTRQLNTKDELIYPATAFKTERLNDNLHQVVLYLNLPTEQIYRANNVARGANIMLASSFVMPSEPCTFTNVCGVIKFKLPATIYETDPQVASITIRASQYMSGTAWINNQAAPKDWKLTMVPSESSSNKLILNSINKPYSELQKEDIYVVLPPQTYSAGLSIDTQDKDGYSICIVTTKKDFTVERGVIHNLGKIK